MTLARIISGGQTGADRGGLEAARVLGLETGGWAPKGYLTERGNDPSLKDFGLQEMTTADYPPRTRLNVWESDGTVIFAPKMSPGSRFTRNCCIGLKKPFLLNPSAYELAEFVESHGITILNVAGSRESKHSGIQEKVKTLIIHAFSASPKARTRRIYRPV